MPKQLHGRELESPYGEYPLSMALKPFKACWVCHSHVTNPADLHGGQFRRGTHLDYWDYLLVLFLNQLSQEFRVPDVSQLMTLVNQFSIILPSVGIDASFSPLETKASCDANCSIFRITGASRYDMYCGAAQQYLWDISLEDPSRPFRTVIPRCPDSDERVSPILSANLGFCRRDCPTTGGSKADCLEAGCARASGSKADCSSADYSGANCS